jgi:gamma-glutamyl-gamma-aminobutyrate hydrolase PuuD
MVNSLHGQGVDRLGKGLIVEAMSPDGVIEGLRYDDETQFIVGVQWHVEWEARQAYAVGRAVRRPLARRRVHAPMRRARDSRGLDKGKR